MLATAGTTSATVLAVLVTGAFIVSAWGFLDLLVRPSLACRVAHVSKSRWLLALGISAVTLLVSTLCLLLVVPATLFIGLGAMACVAGLIGGTWYLAMVRPWVAAQVSFARRRPEAG
jgi:hypothetical protein